MAGTGHRFEKGKSGNPKGRTPGDTVADVIREYLSGVDPERKMVRVAALADKLYTMSMKVKGNPTAARTLLEWGVPKPTQSMDVTNRFDGQGIIVIERAKDAGSDEGNGDGPAA